MSATTLNEVVTRLLVERRFLARFRADPEGAVSGYNLSRQEVDAIKRGDQHELLALGLDRKILDPRPARRSWSSYLLLRLTGTVAAPALLLFAVALGTGTASAETGTAARRAGKRRAARRLVRIAGRRRTGLRGVRARLIRREGHPGIRRARARIGHISAIRATGIARARARVIGDEKPPIEPD